MAKVFLSYDREDLPRAESIARALEKAGHSVWWDRHIAAGAQYSKEIERALKAADGVVVLWSERSIESPWVRDEASSGRDRQRLIPVSLDGCEPPIGFRQFQTIDLPPGRIGPVGRRALLGAVHAVVDEGQKTAPELASNSGPNRTMPALSWILAGSALIALTATILIWRPWIGRSDELVVAVAPAGTDRASQDLARDLAFRLASLQTSSSGAIRLVEFGDAEERPDLTFESSIMAPTHGGLVLKSAEDKSILWSKDFQQPQGQRADLLQQMAYTAAKVTACAMEGISDRSKLKAAVFKTYLNACAQLAEVASDDPQQPVAMLGQVTEASPRFTPAWSKLLLAEATMVSPEFATEIDDVRIARLRQHISEVRKIEPAMAEVAIAEAALLQPRDFAGRVTRIEAAAARSPDNPAVILHLASALGRTGRTREAVETAARAAKLDPLSPNIHSNYIAALAYAGSHDAARRELVKAEKLWPGTASLRDAQYRFHLRYGDPRLAMALLEQKNDAGGRAPRLYLEARKNPTVTNVESFLTYVRARLKSMEDPSAGIGFATLAFGHFGRNEEVISILMAWPRADDVAIISDVLFRPEFVGVRRDQRFMRIAKRAGLLDYWRTSGTWPDFCFEPNLPYDCKAVAAKLAG